MRMSRSQAVFTAQSIITHLTDWRPVWTDQLPRESGYYWLRSGRAERPEVVEVRVDYGEKDAPFVVQSGNPANVGVQFLRDYRGCQWCGPLETPDEQ